MDTSFIGKPHEYDKGNEIFTLFPYEEDMLK